MERDIASSTNTGFRFARDLYGRTGEEEIIDHKRILRLLDSPDLRLVYSHALFSDFSRWLSSTFRLLPAGCQCPQKTEIPPAVFTRFIIYRVNAEWLPVLRKLVPLISLVRSLTDRIMVYNRHAASRSICLSRISGYLNVERCIVSAKRAT